MVKKIFLLLSIFFLFFLVPVKAQNETDLQNQINEYTQKLNELSKSKNTLSNQIKIIDTQVAQTQLKIKQTSNTIAILKKEIANLGVKIGDLDISLNELSAIYIHEINQNYKLPKRIPLISLVTSGSFNNYFENYKYLSIIQKNSQDNLINLETTRTNLDIQKQDKAQKQKELEVMEKQLAFQQKSLATQKSSKNNLLETTKNDEKKYQQMLAEAQSQLASLRRFSSSAGGSTCLSSSPGGGSDGNFYSQRDPRWCNQYIGASKDTIGSVGCYINSISMIYKKLGSNVIPSAYAANSSNFWGNTAYMVTLNPPSGYTYKQVTYNSGTIDGELGSGRYVIAQVKMSNIAGMHFIVIISGSNGNYKIHDPWFGADLNFSDRYSPALVMSLRLITK